MENGKRSKLDIMLKILDIAHMPVRKTHILYKANINFYQLKKYLSLLQELQMLKQIDEPYKGYIVTERGRTMLDLFDKHYEGVIAYEQKALLRELM